MLRKISTRMLRASAAAAKKRVHSVLTQAIDSADGDRPQINFLEPRQYLSRPLGVDVSHYQGTVNWASVYASGRTFAYVKATEGVGVTDATLASNMTNGKAAGLLLGVYQHSTPSTAANDAVNEANYFVQQAGQYMTAGYLRPAVDISGNSALNATQLSSWVNTFISTVQSAKGVEPIVYGNNTNVTTGLTASVTNHGLWIARWSTAYGDPTTTGSPPTGVWGTAGKTWTLWQYSNTGTVPGISGSVDLDSFAGDATALQSLVIGPTYTLSGNASVTGGAFYSLHLNPANLGSHTLSSWSVNWGDGSAAQTVDGQTLFASHIYNDAPSTHTISATITDDLGTRTAWNKQTVTAIYVAPPTVPSNYTKLYTVKVPVADVFPDVGQTNHESYFRQSQDTSGNYHSYVSLTGLVTGQNYLMRASGWGNIENTTHRVLADAEYRFDTDTGTPYDKDPATNIDLGVSFNQINTDTSKGGNWGNTYNDQHYYLQSFTATGTAESLKFFDSEFPNNKPYDPSAASESYISVDVYTVLVPPTLTATANQTGRRIDLAWNDIAGEHGFRIYRGTSASDLQPFGSDVAAGQTSLPDATAVVGTTYYYAIAALDGNGGVGPRSAVVSAVIVNQPPTISGTPDTSFSAIVSSGDAPSTVFLNATIRDFHPTSAAAPNDFQRGGGGAGMVLTNLGADRTPVLNGVPDSILSPQSFSDWFHDRPATTNPAAPAKNITSQIAIPFTLSADSTPGQPSYDSAEGTFFPIDGRYFGDDGFSHNGNFTMEAHSAFTYHANAAHPQQFDFTGDDDVWVFINNQLVIDMGGIHSADHGQEELNSSNAAALGLVDGQTYPFDFFYAERFLGSSNFHATTSIPLFSGNTYSANLTASDPDAGDHLTWHVLQPAGATISPGDGSSPLASILRWTPQASDLGTTQHFKVSVDDGNGNLTYKEWDVAVLSQQNHSPVAVGNASPAPSSAAVGQPFTWNAAGSFSDPDGDPLTFMATANGPAGSNINQLPDYMTLDSDGTFHWTPRPDQQGLQHIHYVVSDGKGGMTHAEFDVDVAGDQPFVTIEANDYLASETASTYGPGQFTVHLSTPAPADGLYVYYTLGGTAQLGDDYSASDADGNEGAVFIPEGQTSGVLNVNIVDDSVSEPTETVIATLVRDPNNFTYAVDTPDTATVYIQDNDRADGDGIFNVIVRATGVPDDQPIELPEGTTAVVTGTVDTHGDRDFRSYWFDLNFNGRYDPGEESASDSAIIDVSHIDGPAHGHFYAGVIGNDGRAYANTKPDDILIDNVAPTVTISGMPETVNVGDTLHLTSTVSDPSPTDTAAGFTYLWSATRNGSDYPIDPSLNGNATLDLPITTAGSYVFKLTATDKDHGAGSASVDKSVDCPTIITPATAVLAEDGTSAHLSVLANSQEGNGDLTYTWSLLEGDDTQIDFDDNETISAQSTTVTFLLPGDYKFKVSAQDLSGNTATSTVQITVPQKYELNIFPPTPVVAPGGQIQLQAGTFDQFGTMITQTNENTLWSIDGNNASISQDGLLVAGTAQTSVTVTASIGGVQSQDVVSVNDSAQLVIAEAVSAEGVKLSWSDTTAGPYTLFRSDIGTVLPLPDNVLRDNITVNQFCDGSVLSGKTYTYEIYAYTTDGLKYIGMAACAVPAFDTIPENSPSLTTGNSETPSAPTDPGEQIPVSDYITRPLIIHATGVNETEILVSLTDGSTRYNLMGGAIIQIATDSNGPWCTAGFTPAFQNLFFIRGCGLQATDYLQSGQVYYIRAACTMDLANGITRGHWSSITTAMSSNPFADSTLTPEFTNATTIIFGGKYQPLSYLLEDVTVTQQGQIDGVGNSVGKIWLNDVRKGYNAYITSSPEEGSAPDGGMPPYDAPPRVGDVVMQNDGSGRLMDEILHDMQNGFHKVGFVGYSHGGGMEWNFSNLLRDSINDPLINRVIFAGTIDAIMYDTHRDDKYVYYGKWDPVPLTVSPADVWNHDTCLGFNEYERHGTYAFWHMFPSRLFDVIRGSKMSGAQYNIRFGLDHRAIGRDDGVLHNMEATQDAQFRAYTGP